MAERARREAARGMVGVDGVQYVVGGVGGEAQFKDYFFS